jgi:hypothetical protein
VDASRRGDERRQEGVTQAWSRVALPIFINLRLSPLREREIKVLMAQGAIQRGVISAAMEVVNCADVHGDSTKRSNAHVEGKHVCHIILILRALMRFLGYCRAPAGAREDRSRPLLSKS